MKPLHLFFVLLSFYSCDGQQPSHEVAGKFTDSIPSTLTPEQSRTWMDQHETRLKAYMENKLAPDFKATTLQEKIISLSELRGKVVVLNFWYIGCQPCMEEMPALNKLVEAYKGKEVVFVSFSLDDEFQIMNEFLPKHPFSYEIIPTADPIGQDYNITGYPTNIVIDKEGVIRLFQQGAYRGERNELLYKVLSDKINLCLRVE